MRLWIIENGFDILATQDEKYDFVIKIAQVDFRYPEILDWLKNNVK